MPIQIYTHPLCLKHDMGPYHPESPARLESILLAVKRSFNAQQITFIEAPQATQEQLTRVHHKDYIEEIFKLAPQTGTVPLDADTLMNPYTLPAALYASGAMIAAVDAVFTGKTQKAVCLVRPPGHHAEPDHAMGFCIFNNIAVGVAHALEKYHCRRVAIVDFDVHHGNGTESMFLHEPRVCFWSSFQHPFYPGATLDKKPPNIHLCPLPAGTGSEHYHHRVMHQLVPLLTEFKPECIFISAGFDAHRLDPLANLNFETQDYAFITEQLRIIADAYCQGRMISTLEGGYDLTALAQSVVAHLSAMI